VGRLAGVSHNAPYKHFADKDDLLAAVAEREFTRELATPTETPTARALMLRYVDWAGRHPERFRMTFGRWTRDHPGLTAVATAARKGLYAAVLRGQAAGELPPSDPQRLTGLVWACAHGAAGLALDGHITPEGRGRARAADLVEALFDHLGASGRG
jgi:AcrR family transcriptional regulator